MKLRAVLSSMSVVASLALSAPAWAGYTLSFGPPAVTGGQVQVDVLLTLDGESTLEGLDLSVAYDASLLRYVGITTGPLSLLVPPNDIGPGLLAMELLALDQVLPSGFDDDIARLSFELRAPGTSELSLEGVVLAMGDFESPPAETVNVTGPVTVTAVPVPEPAAPLLAALGLGLLGWTRRRRAG